MKVLDVNSLQLGIDHAVKDIDSFHEKISAIQRAVRDFHGLDEALKGKGGESIRNFFNEVHQPFLIYLYQSMVEYKNILMKMKQAVDSFESHPNGIVSQEFLEVDVEDGFNKVETRTMQLTADANSIINRVNDLVDIKRIDESGVLGNVQNGKRKAKQIVDQLNELDRYETSLLNNTKDDLQTMRSYLLDIESRFKSGRLSVGNFSLETVRDIEAYRSIMNSIYGEGYIDSIELEPLREKMVNGESMTPDERSELYDYFQNVYLNKKTKNEVKSIADSISQAGIKKLKERLNNVLLSKEKLEEEMAVIQAYVYMGDKRLGELNIDRQTKAKLESYLILLKNHHVAMGKWDETIAKVDTLKYEENPNGIFGHYLESKLQIAPYRAVDREEMSIEKYRDYALRDNGLDGSPVKYFDTTEVRYFTTADASNLENHLKIEKLLEEEANYTSHFIANLVINKIISDMGKSVGMGKAVLEFDLGKENLRDEITVEKVKQTAAFLNMEFSISQNISTPGSKPETEVQLYPTDKTFDFFERWLEVYNDEDIEDIPYPETLIQSQKWKEISEYWIEHNTDTGSLDEDVYEYIRFD